MRCAFSPISIARWDPFKGHSVLGHKPSEGIIRLPRELSRGILMQRLVSPGIDLKRWSFNGGLKQLNPGSEEDAGVEGPLTVINLDFFQAIDHGKDRAEPLGNPIT